MKSSQDKVKAEIEMRNLTSHMNQTKWSRILPCLNSLEAEIKLKWLLDNQPTNWSSKYLIPADGYFEEIILGPIPFREIEWLDLKPKESEKMTNLLKELNIPYSIEADVFRIWGYSNHGVEFV